MSNQHPTIGFIGAGNMTRCLISGLITNHYPSHQIWASNPTAEKLAYLKQQFNNHTTTDNLLAAKHAEIVVLAVKPQMMKSVAQEIAPVLQQTRPLVISIAAGITTTTLQGYLGNNDHAMVRCMPNLPALVNSGATGLFANDFVTVEQRDLAETILRSVGITLWVDDEKLIDVIAALSGSGPAYFFLVMEALEHAAVELGLPKENARLFTLQTAFGAAKLALSTNEDVADLRKDVTSKGGITEKALETLETSKVRDAFAKALRAAYDRSRGLASS
jgi:pyrroline-5-carboxylate reductase